MKNLPTYRRASMNQMQMLGGVPACLMSSDSTEWYTPAVYVNAARELMGDIDCDPASNDIANQIVKAKVYYTKETNGYDKPWNGRVWLNPPYGYDGKKCNQSRWSARMIEQYQAGITTEAVLLVNAKTSERWFQPLWDYPICFTHHRIKFYTVDKRKTGPTHGSVLVYFGPNFGRFYHIFSQFGRVVRATEIPPIPTLWEPLCSSFIRGIA